MISRFYTVTSEMQDIVFIMRRLPNILYIYAFYGQYDYSAVVRKRNSKVMTHIVPGPVLFICKTPTFYANSFAVTFPFAHRCSSGLKCCLVSFHGAARIRNIIRPVRSSKHHINHHSFMRSVVHLRDLCNFIVDA